MHVCVTLTTAMPLQHYYIAMVKCMCDVLQLKLLKELSIDICANQAHETLWLSKMLNIINVHELKMIVVPVLTVSRKNIIDRNVCFKVSRVRFLLR